jgi:DNA-binding response OmpR family regulator
VEIGRPGFVHSGDELNEPDELRPAARQRARILIVEDEPLIAESLRTVLVEAGFEVAGIAGRVEKALQLIEKVGCDAAVLDANLAGASARPAAAALAAHETPFIVLSGYTREQLQPEFLGGVFIQKPYRASQLIDQLSAILAAR